MADSSPRPNALAPIKARSLAPINSSSLPPILTNRSLPPIQNNADILPIYPKLPGLVPSTTNNEFHDSDDENQPVPVLPVTHIRNLPQYPQPNTNGVSNNNNPYVRDRGRNNEAELRPVLPDSNTSGLQSFVAVGKQQTYMLWSILSAVVLFPTLFWIPAVICSRKAKAHFRQNKQEEGRKRARDALIFNILCVKLAIIISIVLITNQKNFFGPKISAPKPNKFDCSNCDCWTYCRGENSSIIIETVIYDYYWTCYDTYASYTLYQYDLRYVDCIRKKIDSVWTYLCRNAYF
jgi:hypothetical protein